MIVINPDKLDDHVIKLQGLDSPIIGNDTVVKNGVITNVAVPEFPRLDLIIFVIALSSVLMTRFPLNKLCTKPMNL